MVNQNYDVNKTRYTHRDYESIKSDLINAIPSLTQEWTTREESDPGIVLIKLMSMFGDTLSYNVDKIALELYIQTVTQRKNCAKILQLLGYKMHWYRSARVVAHVRLVADQDVYSNVNHVIIKPYQTQFLSGQTRYTVVGQGYLSDDIDIFSDQDTTAIYLAQGTPLSESFDKSSLVNNRYYFGTTTLDESEIVLEITGTTRSTVTCKLVDSLYLSSSSRQIYFEFNVDEFDRPYIELSSNWADVAGTDSCNFTVTFLDSLGSQGNISANSFTSATDIEYSDNVNFNNLVINNLDNTTEVDDEGNIDSYNSKGYDPQTVEDAKRDSSNYVFTHDTLVTSSDFEKACKRVEGVTVSKLVDSQVVINDSLDLNEICTRAEDRFDKVFVEEADETSPDVVTVNEYLLQYLVIMYLVYKNFSPESNYYIQSSGTDSLYSLSSYKYDDPYNVKYWEPSFSFISSGDPGETFDLSGPVTNDKTGAKVSVNVYVDRRSYSNLSYVVEEVGGKVKGTIVISDDNYALSDQRVRDIKVVSNGVTILVDHGSYSLEDSKKFKIVIEDNAPDSVSEVVLNSKEIPTNSYVYSPDTDSITFTEFDLAAGADILVSKIFSQSTFKIVIDKEVAPSQVSSIIINGKEVGNYDYSVNEDSSGEIVIRENFGEIKYLIVNNELVDSTYYNKNPKEVIERKKSPGYYPYKMTTPYINDVRQFLDILKVLNVQIEFGTVKVFPFKVVGTLHLVDNYSPQEVLQVVRAVDDALSQSYYPDLHNIGERPDFLELVDIIQNSDERVKYFDAVGNIVEWAPEVKERIDDFEDIFDTTSAIMYNGLSNSFVPAKRFMKFKFRNYATSPDPEEEDLNIQTGTEKGYNLPNDYGTAYLINYCYAAGISPVIKVNPNSYVTIEAKNVSELESLCDDLSFRGNTLMKYLRKFGSTENLDLTYTDSVEREVFNETTYEAGAVDGVNTEFVSDILEVVGTEVPGTFDITYSGSGNFESSGEVVEGKYHFTGTVVTSFTGDGSQKEFKVNKKSSVVKCLVGGSEVQKSTYSYSKITGTIVFSTAPDDGASVVIITAPSLGDTVTVTRYFYDFSVSLKSGRLVTEVNTYNGQLYSVVLSTNPKETYLLSEYDISEIIEMINEHSDDGIPVKFRLVTLPDEQLNKDRIVSVMTKSYTDTPYTQGVVKSEDDEEVEKMVLINNTGLRWIEGN